MPSHAHFQRGTTRAWLNLRARRPQVLVYFSIDSRAHFFQVSISGPYHTRGSERGRFSVRRDSRTVSTGFFRGSTRPVPPAANGPRHLAPHARPAAFRMLARLRPAPQPRIAARAFAAKWQRALRALDPNAVDAWPECEAPQVQRNLARDFCASSPKR